MTIQPCFYTWLSKQHAAKPGGCGVQSLDNDAEIGLTEIEEFVDQ
jgi:hypothetical protein